jgi:uncharacterized protein with PIN domain
VRSVSCRCRVAVELVSLVSRVKWTPDLGRLTNWIRIRSVAINGDAAADRQRERLHAKNGQLIVERARSVAGHCPSRDYVEASHSHERHTVHGLHEHKSHEQDVPCGDGNKGFRFCSSGQSVHPVEKPARYGQNL